MAKAASKLGSGGLSLSRQERDGTAAARAGQALQTSGRGIQGDKS